MAKWTTKQMQDAAKLNLAYGEDAYPEFDEEYELHLSTGDMNVEDFKVGFAMGLAVAYNANKHLIE